jgi:ABC-type multidrug transport system fused ATPase/permease subunit
MIIWKYGRKRQVLLSLFMSLSVAIQPVFLAIMISKFIATAMSRDMSRFLIYAAIAVLGFTGLSILSHAHVVVNNRLIKTTNLAIKNRLGHYLVTDLPLQEDVSTPLSFMTNDLKLLETNGIKSEISGLEQILTFTLAIFAGIYFDWLTTLVFVLGALLPMVISRYITTKVDHRSKDWSDANTHYTQSVKDLLGGLDTIRSYHVETIGEHRLENVSNNLEKALYRLSTLIDASEVWMNYVAFTLGLLIPFGFGMFRIMTGAITIAIFIGIVQLSNSITNPLLRLLDSFNKWSSTRQIQQKIFDMVKEGEKQLNGSTAETFATRSLGSFDKLTLKDVTIFRGSKAIISDLNLTIRSGEKVLLRAPSGAGKSTLLRALEGQVRISGEYKINGTLISEVSRREIFSIFGQIKQNPFLFNDTILFNVTLSENFDLADINIAARRAQLSAVISQKGWNYLVGEGGLNLSGGQAQRVEIARALLRHRPVILADEVTSALDEKTSNLIRRELFAEPSTLIEVAHHIDSSWLDKYDQVIDLLPKT